MKTIAIVQARLGSTRLPRKVLRVIHGRSVIELLLCRLSRAKELDEIIIATGDDRLNAELVDHVSALGYRIFAGSEQDVLGRVAQAARFADADVIVRITGDCPLIDASIVDQTVALLRESGADYASNVDPPTFPDGLDVEVFTRRALDVADREAKESSDREHVTSYMRREAGFARACLSNETDLSGHRWTVDEPEDLEVIANIIEALAPDLFFSWSRVIELALAHPRLFIANTYVPRNQGASMTQGQKLWKRAKRVIPGGNMLLSKRPEMFLPDQWPAYFSRAKGITVWDLDDIPYTDMSIMGIGTNTLGYGNEEVDSAVADAVARGNMSTLNAPEEVELAERLVALHPWADMVRFARSGGEANAIAIRIARAASGRDKVAICGYHGWHDWYLSTNLGNAEGLDEHLLPGLSPQGVPRNLRGTVLPFRYNDYEGLATLVREHDIGVIKMEVSRNEGPEGQFLERVRELATREGIVLVFDECTSGFRQAFGGLHKVYGVEPDMAIFGKALGNGYAVTAVIGRREIMEAAQSTFISSTFWTERIGSAAGLRTLDVMESVRSWETITEVGLEIKARWHELADEAGLAIETWGLPALAGFTFLSKNHQAYRTLVTQEMLIRGYLATNNVYACVLHTPDVIDAYFENLRDVFVTIGECEEGRDIGGLLHGPVAHQGFTRLN